MGPLCTSAAVLVQRSIFAYLPSRTHLLIAGNDTVPISKGVAELCSLPTNLRCLHRLSGFAVVSCMLHIHFYHTTIYIARHMLWCDVCPSIRPSHCCFWVKTAVAIAVHFTLGLTPVFSNQMCDIIFIIFILFIYLYLFNKGDKGFAGLWHLWAILSSG